MVLKAFSRLVITSSGRIPGHTQSDIERLIEECGAKFEQFDVSQCTHLITTQKYLDNPTIKVAHALGQKSCNIVSIDWLLRSFEKNRALSSKSFWLRPTQSEAENVSPVTKEGDSQQKKRKFTSGVGDEKSSVERAKEMIQANREYLADRVDEGYQGDKTHLVVWMDADETVWDTTMIRGRNVSQLDKSALHAGIYRIQLLYDIEKNTCCVWYCQSVAGSMEQTTTVGIGGLKWGKRRFEKLFQVATSLSWENRRSLPGQNGWIFIQSPSEYEKTTSNSVQQPIPTTAQGVLRFLFSERKREIYQRLINLFSGPRLKKPQYQIRRHTLQTAIAILERILRILAEGTGSNLKANEKESSKKTEFGLEFLWLFYLDLLRVDQIDQTSNSDQYGPWRIDSTSLGFGCITMDSVLRELQDLRFILNLNTINRIIKQDSQLMDEALMQRAFRTLGLEKMKLVQVHSPEYSALTEYLNGSIGSTHRLKYMVHSIFRIRRPGEEERFDREEARDRRLLWHGTSSDNIIGILNQGLRAHLFNKSKNAMFGAGIYFADMSSKSARYCASSGPAFLLLCEVELGSSHIIRTSSDRDVAEEKTTVIAHGQLQHRQLRSAQYIHHKLKDVLMPDIQAGKTYAQEHKLFYNEYIVYDPCQIRQRYLFHMDIY